MTIIDDGYRRLANAIIYQAIDDYRKGNSGRKSEVGRFFNSPWCQMLLPKDIDGATIKRRIKGIKIPKAKDW